MSVQKILVRTVVVIFVVTVGRQNKAYRARRKIVDLTPDHPGNVDAVIATVEMKGPALAAVIIRDLAGGDVVVLNAAAQATALLLGYWGLRFGVLGVYVSGRTREKEATITGQLAPAVIEQIVKALRRR